MTARLILARPQAATKGCRLRGWRIEFSRAVSSTSTSTRR